VPVAFLSPQDAENEGFIMAFSLIHNFRKYQKFWMASILLLCMITFVLCTGVGGDLSDFLIKMFGTRRGTPVAQVNGYNVYLKELEDLRLRRNVADVFMRSATRLAIEGLEKRLKDLSLNKTNVGNVAPAQRPTAEFVWKEMRQDLSKRIGLDRPRYFSGGVKYDDLLDFKLWLQQADRLGIYLERDAVQTLIYQAIYGGAWGWNNETVNYVSRQVQSNNYLASDEVIYQSLRDEFRVQIAQLALLKARPDLIFEPESKYYGIRNLGGPPRGISVPAEIRRPLAPEQLWADYRKQCSTFDVALVPVPVADFQSKVPAPKEDELKDFYERNRENEFNPTLDRPSFKFPTRMKVQWVSANPKSPEYRKLSRAATTLEIMPAVAWYPMLSTPLLAARYASGSAAWDTSLQRNYDNLKARDPYRFQAPPLTAPNFLMDLANILEARDAAGDAEQPSGAGDKNRAMTAAAAIAVAGRPGLGVAVAPLTLQADVYFRHKKELAQVLPSLVKPRVPLAATMVLSGAASKWLALGNWLAAEGQPQYLPLDLVRDELRDKIEVKMAEGWAVRNMLEVKTQLNLPGTPGKKSALERRLDQLKKRYGLEVGSTEQFYNRYDIAKAPSLQPLLKSFEKYREEINTIEGRAGTPQYLKEDDFWRLFFDSSIGFSIENAGLYVARPWPPYVKSKPSEFGAVSTTVGEGQTIPLFTMSGHPFLFWQTEFEPARTPKSLDEVRDKVVAAWKEGKARDEFGLPRARAVAEALQQAGKDLRTVLNEEAAKLGTQVITLRDLAPLVPTPSKDPREPEKYEPYKLPKALFTYPRDDMVKELLRLNELTPGSKDAIKAGSRELDELNEKLLDRKMPGKQVQVLTNSPHTFYYVAVVTSAPEPSRAQFANAYAAVDRQVLANDFVRQAQMEAGKTYQAAIVEQLRRAYLVPNEEARKNFDRDGGGT
jgi:hypothetical protein